MAGDRDALRVSELETTLVSFFKAYVDAEGPSEMDGVIHQLAQIIRRIEVLEDKDEMIRRWLGRPVGLQQNHMDPRVEAFLTLQQKLQQILANDWDDLPSRDIKSRIQMAMADSMRIFI